MKDSLMIFFFCLVWSQAISQSKPYDWPDSQPENCPFPESKEITKVKFTGRYANYTGADTWFPMWAPDGNCYSPYTDGSIGSYASVSHYSNMWPELEDENHHTGQAVLIGDDPMSLKVKNLGKMSTPYANLYPCASVIADGIWYYGIYDAFNNEGYFAGWRYSTDYNHFTEEQGYPWTNKYWKCANNVSDEWYFFDCGGKENLKAGHTVVGFDEVYSKEKGYGWNAPLEGDVDRGKGSLVTRDFSYCHSDRTFKLDLKNGAYRIMIFMGDKGAYAHDRMNVLAEGAKPRLYEISDWHYNKTHSAIPRLPLDTRAGQILPLQFDVRVDDGQLDLFFRDQGGDDPNWVVNAIYVRHHNDGNFFNETGKAKFRVPRAVVFGQDNNLSPDGKIYFVSHGYSSGTGTDNWCNGDALYLCRVDEGVGNVTDNNKSEFCDGSKWDSSVENSRPILDWPDNLGGATISWNQGLGKYILMICHHRDDGIGQYAREHRVIFMESDKITGPYKTIHYMVNLGPRTYFANIPAKWISEDGKTAWLVVASRGNWVGKYACSMHEIEFVTAGH